MTKVGRNDPCPCGSGKKYKNCCMKKDQEEQTAVKYTPSGKRKFKATVLGGSEKALSVFGRSSPTPQAPVDSDALARLKYRMANKDYRVEETSQEPLPFPFKP
ncbi:MAG: hypothetical protein K940chlam9_01877, partial [Chlamydiae bacterium]|nr:hypothetical protein [Chlamydiota bacterium]